MNYDIEMAPLQGYTDYIWRNAHSAIFGGIKNYYSPFLRLEKGELRKRDLNDILPENNRNINFTPQIIACDGKDAQLLATRISELGYSEININLGCPFPLIAGRKKGSGMLAYPELIETMFEFLSKVPNIKYSIKMRLGYKDANDWQKALPLIDSFNPSKIIIHPRTGISQYKGDNDMKSFDQFYNECNFPLIFNGGINSKSDIDLLFEKYPKLSSFMVGRALLSNPALFSKKNATIVDYCEFHSIITNRYKSTLCGDNQILMKCKSLWDYYMPWVDKKLLKAIKKSSSLKKYEIEVAQVWKINHQINHIFK